MKTNKTSLIIPAFLLVASLGVSAKASATMVNTSVGVHAPGISVNAEGHGEFRGGPEMNGKPDIKDGNAVFGKVIAVNGSTITISSMSRDKNNTNPSNTSGQATTTYTINTSASTTIDKNRVAGTLSSITVGDNIMVEGTISGTTVTATKIHDGVLAKGAMQTPGTKGMSVEGNGQPVIGGTVTAVSGNTITITNKSNVAYTIDVTNAKIMKSGTTAAVSNIAVGDELVAQGTINGNSVVAVNVVDSPKLPNSASDTGKAHGNFFGLIGNFFSKLFGFGK